MTVIPASTYRLQLHAGFPFRAAAGIVDYLADLGVSHLYLSPIQQAAAGSMHGYDVVDPSRINDELGGAEGFAELSRAAKEAGLGLVLDIVPNHVCVDPAQANAWWWDVLAHGRESAHGMWFDIDWSQHRGRVLLPVLGDDVDSVHREDGEIAYHERRFPDTDNYELAHWRRARDELNYRRFFDITSLAAVRPERPEVFEAISQVPIQLARSGAVDGLRVDHIDGLADPRDYLDKLATATHHCWVTVEKILEPGEALPRDWQCNGTTGYDALNAVQQLFIDPDGEGPLTTLYQELTEAKIDWQRIASDSKRFIVESTFPAEVNRLARAAGEHLREAIVEMLIAFSVYRAYVHPGESPPSHAVERLDRAHSLARATRPDLSNDIDEVRRLAVHGPPDFVVRFQQTCGDVMAKGVEDTAFYRYNRLTALNEVGGDPGTFGRPVADFHAFCARTRREWPTTMTTLSTHDTKHGEDVRARLAVLSEIPDEWAQVVTEWMARHPSPDPNLGYLTWQTLVGAWPLPKERALTYLQKATREAKEHTSWTDPDPDYDQAVVQFVDTVYADDELLAEVAAFVERIAIPGLVNALAAKIVQLTMPGIPDIYQGDELPTLSLVDPDDRRPVDFDHRRSLLKTLEGAPPVDATGRALLYVTTRALRLRRAHPEWFGPSAIYRPLDVRGSKANHLVAFSRADSVVTIAPRLPVGLGGNWGDTLVALSPGRWTGALSGFGLTVPDDGWLPLRAITAAFPVALLVRTPE
jgi:(1->4)-alpha-D-glucan 1-alpha-D-glucosylmutase